MNRNLAPLVTQVRAGAAAQTRIDSGHPLPGDEARVREAAKAEKKLVKHGVSVEGARRGTIHPARGSYRRLAGARA